jgi:hypothetical protein
MATNEEIARREKEAKKSIEAELKRLKAMKKSVEEKHAEQESTQAESDTAMTGAIANSI